MMLGSKESQSKARVALAAAAGVVVGFGIGYTLQAYRHDDKRNVGVDEDHKLHQKIMSLRNQLINAEKVMDEMITDLKMRVDNVMGSHGTGNSCATINSSKNEYLTYLLSRLKKKLARTLSGFEKVSRQDSGLKSQLLECQSKFQRLESLPIGHTEFSWNGSKNGQNALLSTGERTSTEHTTEKLIGFREPSPDILNKKMPDAKEVSKKVVEKRSSARKKRFSMMGNVFNTAVRLNLATDLKAVFKRLDKTGKEYISRDDLRNGIKKMHLEHIIHNDSELEQLWVAMDLDEDNRISYADFETFCKLHDPKAKEYKTKKHLQIGSAQSRTLNEK